MKEIPFKTSEAQISQIPSIIKQMESVGIDNLLLNNIIKYGAFDQGLFDLMMYWSYSFVENNTNECKLIIGDLIESVKDYKNAEYMVF